MIPSDPENILIILPNRKVNGESLAYFIITLSPNLISGIREVYLLRFVMFEGIR